MKLHSGIDHRGSGQQRGRLVPSDSGRTRLGQIIQDFPFLLSQCCDRSQNTFDEATSGFALGAETAAAPQDGAPQPPLGVIVGGFHAFHPHKGPQRNLQLHDVRTRAAIAPLRAPSDQGSGGRSDWMSAA